MNKYHSKYTVINELNRVKLYLQSDLIQIYSYYKYTYIKNYMISNIEISYNKKYNTINKYYKNFKFTYFNLTKPTYKKIRNFKYQYEKLITYHDTNFSYNSRKFEIFYDNIYPRASNKIGLLKELIYDDEDITLNIKYISNYKII